MRKLGDQKLLGLFTALHQAACERRGIAPDKRGAKLAVAKSLSVQPQQYSDALLGHRGSTELFLMWARRLRLRVVQDEGGTVTIGNSTVKTSYWTRCSRGAAIQRDFTKGLTDDENELIERLFAWSAMRGEPCWYWGTATAPNRWELEGKAGIVWFGPNETDTDNPTSGWVIGTRRVPGLAGVSDVIEAARIVVRHLALL